MERAYRSAMISISTSSLNRVLEDAVTQTQFKYLAGGNQPADEAPTQTQFRLVSTEQTAVTDEPTRARWNRVA